MSIHFHPLKIKEINKETVDCVSVLFEIPDKLERRTYSLCSSPLDKECRVAIKKVEGGLFSTFANDILKKDDVLEVMEPVGKFYTELHPDNKKNYLAFAAGSGITPVLSIIKTTLRTEPNSTFTLVYGNKSRASVIFFEELEGLKNKFIERFNLINILSRERTESTINFGRIKTDKLNELEKLVDYSSIDETFICGPEEMIFCVKDFLQQKGISEKKIHFELFTTAGQKTQGTRYKVQGTSNTGPQSNITVKVDGRSFDFDLALNSEITILDAALKQGADLPYACKGGMCCTCKARLLEGGLEHEEVEKGFILTCQSHPKTEKVVVDFDIK
jgi:ring-1,2-phenylacetyl-CoA epoxidase subunit PaaE